MTDWADILADQILANMQAWVAEAGQLAQNEQSSDAFDAHMHECLVDKIRWIHANHSNCGNDAKDTP